MNHEPETATEEAVTMPPATNGAAAPDNVTALPVVTQPRREVRAVSDPIPVLDTARFEHMQRVASAMAYSSLVPQALTHVKQGEGQNAQLVPLAPQQVIANCFLVVNQAVRWGMDPFAVGQCVSVVHGKLCYEGKLIAAVIDAKAGFKLEYEISGEGEAMQVVVSATLDGNPVLDSKGRPKIVTGTVAEWKTDGRGSPWSARGGYPRMLRYRGAREWCRVHEPALMLGVYSPDEFDDLAEDYRARRARDVSGPIDPPEPDAPALPPPANDAGNNNAPAEPAKPAEPSTPPEPTEPVGPPEPTEPTAEAPAGEVVWTEEGERPATAEDAPAEPSKPKGKRTDGERVAPMTGKNVVMSAAGTPIESALMYPDRWIAECKEAAAKCSTLDALKAAADDLLKGRETRVRPEQFEEARLAFARRETEIADAAGKAEAFDVEQWLKDLGGAFDGCEDVASLCEEQARLMTPHKDKVSSADYERAGKLAVAAFARISGAGQ